jgi:hypothetical protein
MALVVMPIVEMRTMTSIIVIVTVIMNIIMIMVTKMRLV